MFTKVLIAILILLVLLFFLAIASRERERADRAEELAMAYEKKCAAQDMLIEEYRAVNKVLAQENEELRAEIIKAQEREHMLLDKNNIPVEHIIESDCDESQELL